MRTKAKVKIPKMDLMSKEVKDGVSRALAKYAYNKLLELISDPIKGIQDNSVRAAYRKALVLDGNKVSLVPPDKGFNPVWIERGMSSFSMKAAMLANSGKGYVDVPISHSPPTRLKPAKATDQLKSDWKTLRNMFMTKQSAVEARAKRAGFSPVDSASMAQSATMRLSGVSVGKPGKSGVSIYDNMIRTGGRFNRRYLTIRRISANSTGWKHPGFRARRYFKQVQEFLPAAAAEIVAGMLSGKAGTLPADKRAK